MKAPRGKALGRLPKAVLLLSLSLFAVASGCAAPTEEVGEDGAAIETGGTNRQVAAGTKLYVTALGLNLRATSSTSGRILTVLRSGAQVTVATTSGSNGWVNVRSADGATGWAYGRYLDDEASEQTTVTGPISGDTCSPSRGQNVVNRYEKALHDVIAFAEGTRGRSKDGYDVMYSFKIASACNRHPNQCLAFRNTCSTAAGRYQFLSSTWNGVARVKRLTSFEPENQERGAEYLVSSVRKASIPKDRPLTAAEFTNVMSKLSFEWASLPPARYGQGVRTIASLRSTYCSLVDC